MKESEVVDIFPSPASIKGLRECGYIVTSDTPLKTRLIRVILSTRKIEVLMTNLWEEEGYAVTEFKELYSMRWRVETNIGFQKNSAEIAAESGTGGSTQPPGLLLRYFVTIHPQAE